MSFGHGTDEKFTTSSVPDVSVALSTQVKFTLLFVLCFAQFIDAFNNTAFIAAIPPIAQDLNISNSRSVWLLSGYQLTLAALLLSSGRLSDLYNPKWVFVAGTLLMSLCALGAGFVRSEIPLVVLRAFMGIGAALNIPSAMSLIIWLFPEPATQSQALAAFACAAGIGNVLGLITGALLVSFADWPWVLYFTTILTFILAIATIALLPSKNIHIRDSIDGALSMAQLKRLDPVGVSSLTIALILFIFAVTSGSVDGWGTAQVIAPLVLSVVLAVCFVFWEAHLPTTLAAVPPSMWKYPDFPILIAVSLQPFMWWASVQLLFSWLYQEVYGWSTIMAAVHFLPLGLITFPIMAIASTLQQRFPLKWIILFGQVLALAGTVLLPFADSKERYWSLTLPGFILGSSGMLFVFTTTNIALFANTPPEVAGIVGAIFTCALQLENHGGPNGFYGRAAGFWFLFAFGAVEIIGVLAFMRRNAAPVKHTEEANIERIEELEVKHSDKSLVELRDAE
ncbi:hypothetical protein A0H81_05744 [Grifola frondosa]|uniref:Major facilitator superfamily (MFS) profile domain-containing protein n=1 Tax=Grifola frondosa TaxID=5627 RepID=A0A1C7MD02_GRIFR|nr:hypothetical protein A0H81_05744 [Grifola frondosa]